MKAEDEVQTLLVPGHENNFWEVMAEKNSLERGKVQILWLLVYLPTMLSSLLN